MYQKTEVQSSEKRRTGDTGIPAGTQRRFEEQYNVSFADVRVHYNSQEPARLGALAFARGTQVYLGPGQERYLNHELGHVIQQKRGLVPATVRVGGYPVNDDARLEREADVIAAFRGPAIQEERGQAGAAQLTTAVIEYKVNGGTSYLVPGPRVVVKGGVPGVSHAEQRAWNLVSGTICGLLKKGNHVDITFHIDELVCTGCREWFDQTLYSDLVRAANTEPKGDFSLSVIVKHTNAVEVLGTRTVWTNEAADKPTWDRMEDYALFDKFMSEQRDEKGVLGAAMDPRSTLDAYGLISYYIGQIPEFQDMLVSLLGEAKTAVLSQSGGDRKSHHNDLYPQEARTRVSKMTLYQLLQELKGITYEHKPLEKALIELTCWNTAPLRQLLQDYLQMYLAYNYEMEYVSDDKEQQKKLHDYPDNIGVI